VFEEFSTHISFVLTNLSIGTHHMTVVVDPYNEVEEQNESNNTATFIVKVTTTENEPSSVIDLIKTLMGNVNVTMTKPDSNLVIGNY
ncbi:MAG: CARDB domain-containing protein, partial [Planctomycetota bacterium]